VRQRIEQRVEWVRLDRREPRSGGSGNPDAERFETRFLETPYPQKGVRLVTGGTSNAGEVAALVRGEPPVDQGAHALDRTAALDVHSDRALLAYGDEHKITRMADVEVHALRERRTSDRVTT
jgi:hypothetical protein